MKEYPNAAIGLEEVDNPYFNPAYEEANDNPRKITAAVNTRECSVSTLVARGHLSKSQGMVATKFRRFWEMAGGVGARAIDYSKQRVDGGGFVDPISDRALNAAKVLNNCQGVLGNRNFNLVVQVCGEGRSPWELADSRRQKQFVMDSLRTSLDDLARFWGLAT